MGKTNEFDLDLKVKAGAKEGIEPRITSKIACTMGCVTGVFMTCMSNGCK